jgi:tRNA(adenine34) deaminase
MREMMSDERWMEEALKEAAGAYEEGEVPVGAVVVADGCVIGRGHNRVESLKDPTAHAEIIAITAACGSKKDWRLEDATLYVTLEPCPMCGGAILLSRLQRVVFGASDPRMGCCGSVYEILEEGDESGTVSVSGGTLGSECKRILQEFFRERRVKKQKAP